MSACHASQVNGSLTFENNPITRTYRSNESGLMNMGLTGKRARYSRKSGEINPPVFFREPVMLPGVSGNKDLPAKAAEFLERVSKLFLKFYANGIKVTKGPMVDLGITNPETYSAIGIG